MKDLIKETEVLKELLRRYESIEDFNDAANKKIDISSMCNELKEIEKVNKTRWNVSDILDEYRIFLFTINSDLVNVSTCPYFLNHIKAAFEKRDKEYIKIKVDFLKLVISKINE